jgi:hypothetical protein
MLDDGERVREDEEERRIKGMIQHWVYCMEMWADMRANRKITGRNGATRNRRC